MRQARAAGAKTLFFSWQNLSRRYPPPFNLIERQVLTGAITPSWATRRGGRGVAAKRVSRAVSVIPQFGVDPTCSPRRPPATPAGLSSSVRPTAGWCREGGRSAAASCGDGCPACGGSTLPAMGPSYPVCGNWRDELGIAGPRPLRRCWSVRSGAGLSCAIWTRWCWLRGRCPTGKSSSAACWSRRWPAACPCFGTRSGEIPHVIGHAGLIVPEGDEAALHAHLLAVMQSASLRDELGKNGRQRVLAHYTQKQVAEQTTAVYREMLAAR
jgi:hypothetical protein